MAGIKHNPEMDLILSKAYEFAAKLQHKYVTIEHLTLALVNYKNFKIMLEEYGCDQEQLAKDVKAYLDTLPIATEGIVDPQ